VHEVEGIEDARDEEADEAAGEPHIVETVALMKVQERAGYRRKDEADSDSACDPQRDADCTSQAYFEAEVGDDGGDRRSEEGDDRVGAEAHLGELAGEKDADDDGNRVVEGIAEEREAHHRHDRRQRRAGEVDRGEVHQDKAQKADARHVQEGKADSMDGEITDQAGAPGLQEQQLSEKVFRSLQDYPGQCERAQDDQHQQIESSFAFMQKQPPSNRSLCYSMSMRGRKKYFRLVIDHQLL